MIKIIGCLIIILSSSTLGFLMGSKFNLRVRELKLLKVSLQMLETEIAYSNTPLPEAFDNISKRSKNPIKDIFSNMSINLYKRIYSTVGEAFDVSIEKIKDKTCFSKDDLEVLKSFGNSIGTSDVNGQIKAFKLVLKQLDQQEIKAEEQRCKNEKMYKSLGFLAGVAIALILI